MCGNYYPGYSPYNLGIGARGCCNSGVSPYPDDVLFDNSLISTYPGTANSCSCYNRGYQQGYRVGRYERCNGYLR